MCLQYLPLILIFVLNFQILKVAREQRKRILAEETIVRQVNEQSPERETSALRTFQASKAAKTFFIIVIVLAFCVVIPTVVGLVLFHGMPGTRYVADMVCSLPL